MSEEQRQAWNAAVARGDVAEIAALRREILRDVHAQIMDDDANYRAAGWGLLPAG